MMIAAGVAEVAAEAAAESGGCYSGGGAGGQQQLRGSRRGSGLCDGSSCAPAVVEAAGSSMAS